MPRVKRSVHSKKRRRNVLREAKGSQGPHRNKERMAKQRILKAGQYAFRDRRNKKRDFRGLWQIRINAAARELGTTYSRLIDALTKSKIGLDRKVLAQLAVERPAAFKAVVEKALSTAK